MKTKIIIVGAFHEIIELALANDFEIVGLIDNHKTGYYYNYKILGTDEKVNSLDVSLKEFPLILTPDKPEIRKKLFTYYNDLGFSFTSIISVKANVSKTALIQEGIIVQNGVNVSSEAKIGRFVKLNTNCNIMHNSIIKDYATIAPNAVILGNVEVGVNCYIGANATILPNIIVGSNVTVGAGSVVTKNIASNSIVLGNPAKLFKIR